MDSQPNDWRVVVVLLARAARTALDVVLLSAAFLASWLLRFEGGLPGERLSQALALLPYVIGLEYALLALFGVERRSWRYVGLREVSRIVGAIGTATALLLAVRLTSAPLLGAASAQRWGLVIPIGVIGINSALGVLALTTGRVLRRLQIQERERPPAASWRGAAPGKRALLVGAGRAGARIAEEMQRRPNSGYVPVGFVDDDPWKLGQIVGGVKVLDNTDDIAEVAERLRVDEVVITISAVRGTDIRRITDQAARAGIPVKIIPDLMDLVGQHVNLSRIRPVAIDDLLGRAPVELDLTAIRSYIEHEVVLVTGAGGSIGSELCRQLSKFHPRQLILVDRSEPALWAIHHALSSLMPEPSLRARLVDVRDEESLDRLFLETRPSVVFHAAAHKHVPIVEANPGEAVRNNVFGTKLVADLAAKRGIQRFVLISTDKAVNPTSVMGATKRVAERYVQHLAEQTGRPYVSVRFGNVLGSAGSVVNVFKQQVESGGPLTVTHRDMRRYFMTVNEAAQLVLQAGSMGEAGQVFLLDMGEPVRIVDLAADLVRLSGLQLGRDIELAFTGLRPGEKLFEELSLDEEEVDHTTHPKIFIMRRLTGAWPTAAVDLDTLQRVAATAEAGDIRRALAELVPEFTPNPTGEIPWMGESVEGGSTGSAPSDR